MVVREGVLTTTSLSPKTASRWGFDALAYDGGHAQQPQHAMVHGDRVETSRMKQ